MSLVSENTTPPDLILKGSGQKSQVSILIILGARQPIEVAINLCASFQQQGYTVIVTHVDEENDELKLPMLISQYKILEENIYNLRSQDDTDLIDAEFKSMVSNLSIDESTQSTYLDTLSQIEDFEKFIAPDPKLPEIKNKINRIATIGLIGGPLISILAAILNFDPFGVEPWPGVLATVGGLGTLLYRWNLTREEGDDGAHI